jgi:hypothetical protein
MLLFGERVWHTPAWLDRLLPSSPRRLPATSPEAAV